MKGGEAVATVKIEINIEPQEIANVINNVRVLDSDEEKTLKKALINFVQRVASEEPRTNEQAVAEINILPEIVKTLIQHY